MKKIIIILSLLVMSILTITSCKNFEDYLNGKKSRGGHTDTINYSSTSSTTLNIAIYGSASNSAWSIKTIDSGYINTTDTWNTGDKSKYYSVSLGSGKTATVEITNTGIPEITIIYILTDSAGRVTYTNTSTLATTKTKIQTFVNTN